MTDTRAVTIRGLDELQKELRRLDESTLTKELSDARYDVAKLVADKAQGMASTRLERKAAGSLVASKSGDSAQLSYGGPEYPYAMGAEFGSHRYRQFRTFRGRQGYFVYPAVRALHDEITRVYLNAFDRIIAKAFPD